MARGLRPVNRAGLRWGASEWPFSVPASRLGRCLRGSGKFALNLFDRVGENIKHIVNLRLGDDQRR